MIQLEKSKAGVMTVKYNDKYIHSKYDPISEGERFAKSNLENVNSEIIPVYGLGLGYHIVPMTNYLKGKSVIYVFEYNDEIIKLCKTVNPEIFTNKKIKIITADDSDFFIKLAKSINRFGDIIIHKPSLEAIKESNKRLYNLIYDFSITKQYSKIDTEIIRMSEENIKANKNLDSLNIEKFINKNWAKNKRFIIVSAGPSVDDDLEELKKIKDDFNIICVGSVLRTLLDNNIIPDAVVIIDTKEIVKRQFEGLEEKTKNIDLCFAASASKEALKIYSGPKYIFNDTDSKTEINTGGTVAIAAMDIAIKCGCRQMIFLGQDLAFIKDKSHTQAYEKTYGFKDDYKNYIKYEQIKGVNGEMLYTLKGYIRFKHKIEALIRKNSKVDFINCSKGVIIEGARHMNLKDVLNEVKE